MSELKEAGGDLLTLVRDLRMMVIAADDEEGNAWFDPYDRELASDRSNRLRAVEQRIERIHEEEDVP